MKDTLTAAILGGLIEGVCLYPLDVFKSKLQVKRKNQGKIGSTIFSIVQDMKKEQRGERWFAGVIRSCWKGTTPFVFQLATKYVFRLGSFDYLKNDILPSSWNLTSRILYASLGCSVVESMCIVTPTEIVKIRLQLHSQTHSHSYSRGTNSNSSLNLRTCINDMIKNEGIFSFWKGGMPTLLRQCSNQVSTFLGIHYLNRTIWPWIQNQNRNQNQSEKSHSQTTINPSIQSFVNGFLAGMIGPLLNNGMDVVKTRRMAATTTMRTRTTNLLSSSAPFAHEKNKYLFFHMWEIAQKEGFLSLYSGVGLRIARTGLGQAILWTVLQKFSPNLLK